MRAKAVSMQMRDAGARADGSGALAVPLPGAA